MSLALLSIGTAVPPTTINQNDAAKIAIGFCRPTDEQRTWLPLMYEQTGIQTRHMSFDPAVVADFLNNSKYTDSCFLPKDTPDDFGPTTGERMQLYRENAARLSLQSLTSALQKADMPPQSITHLVSVSCTGFQSPGFDLELIELAKLSPSVQRTHIGFMGCHGALNGLRVVRAFAESSSKSRIAMVATELCSLHYHYRWNPSKMIANALFADGSAAIVGVSQHAHAKWILIDSASHVVPGTADVMTWSVGDHGFEMTLDKQVPQLIRQHLRPWLERWLHNHQIKIQDVGSWAVHPGGPKILDSVEEGLALRPGSLATSREIFAEFGNMSSPTVLFILDRLSDKNVASPCVALGFGPGLTVEAALLNRE